MRSSLSLAEVAKELLDLMFRKYMRLLNVTLKGTTRDASGVAESVLGTPQGVHPDQLFTPDECIIILGAENFLQAPRGRKSEA